MEYFPHFFSVIIIIIIVFFVFIRILLAIGNGIGSVERFDVNQLNVLLFYRISFSLSSLCSTGRLVVLCSPTRTPPLLPPYFHSIDPSKLNKSLPDTDQYRSFIFFFFSILFTLQQCDSSHLYIVPRVNDTRLTSFSPSLFIFFLFFFLSPEFLKCFIYSSFNFSVFFFNSFSFFCIPFVYPFFIFSISMKNLFKQHKNKSIVVWMICKRFWC